MNNARRVPIRSGAELAMAKRAGMLAAEVLQMIAGHVKPGVTTDELDALCHDYIVNVQRAIPANVGYHGYPKTICASVNHVICHGIPSARALKSGDIINIDVAVILAQRLVRTTYEAMRAGIEQVRPGATLGDVGHAIQTVAHREGFSVVREYGGHGIGTVYHDELHVPHYGRPGTGLRLEAGMVFTIEPMINAGKAAIKHLADGWTVVTKDHSLSAQWEHMVAVTPSGFDILTPWPEGFGEYPAISPDGPEQVRTD